jgi:DNA-binding MarR family transcriptional regulator
MGEDKQMKRKQERDGIPVPILPLGGSKRLSASDWRKDLLVSWLFQTCIRLQTSFNRRFQRFGMTVPEASVLLRCVEARQSSPGKLSVVLGRDKAMVTRFVDRLEAARLITRQRNRVDRRRLIIRPTGKGKRLAQDLASVFEKVRQELFVGTLESEVGRLGQLLSRLHENAERMGAPSKRDVERRRIGRRGRRGVSTAPYNVAAVTSTECETPSMS